MDVSAGPRLRPIGLLERPLRIDARDRLGVLPFAMLAYSVPRKRDFLSEFAIFELNSLSLVRISIRIGSASHPERRTLIRGHGWQYLIFFFVVADILRTQAGRRWWCRSLASDWRR